jgi:hypothetical protein
MCRILTIFVKKICSDPNAACFHATFLIEVFVHVAIENKRLSCLLCISAIIGVAPNRRYTAAVAVLFGNACNLLIVLRWKFVSSSRSFLGKCTVSSPYKSLGMTYA